MPKIEEIDYDQMMNKASSISGAANDMQTAIKEAYGEMANMQSNWNGMAYDKFVESANEAIGSLNKLFEATVSDIPHEIARKAKSYSKMNQSELGVSFREQTVLILTELSKTNRGSKVKFKSDGVTSSQNTIKSKFESAKTSADAAQKVAESLKDDWQSVSGDNNIRELISCFKKVKSIISRLSTQMDSLIASQEMTANAIETAANTVEKAHDVVESSIDSAIDKINATTENIKQAGSDVWTNIKYD